MYPMLVLSTIVNRPRPSQAAGRLVFFKATVNDSALAEVKFKHQRKFELPVYSVAAFGTWCVS